MRRTVFCLPVCVLVLGCIAGADAEEEQEKPRVHPFKMPRLPKAPPLTAEESKEIDEIVASLSKIKDPDFGLSSTISGSSFPPVPDAEHASSLIFMAHNLKRADSVTRLVALGPKALPELLAHLDDKTQTELAIEHKYGIGGMWYDHELPVNPASAGEVSGAGVGCGVVDDSVGYCCLKRPIRQ